MESRCNMRFLLRFEGPRLTVKSQQESAKSRADTCVHTRVSPRREFSFHGQKDNPSLCHFSSVFLSPRLIELLRLRPRISVTFHFLPSPFHRQRPNDGTVVSTDTVYVCSTVDEIGFRHSYHL